MAYRTLLFSLICLLFFNCLVESRDLVRVQNPKTTSKVQPQTEAPTIHVPAEIQPTDPTNSEIRGHDNSKPRQDKVVRNHEQQEPNKENEETESNKVNPNIEHSQNKGFKGNVIMLGDHPSCADDIQRLCHEIPKENNFQILSCIQDKAKEDDIAKECHNLLWSYKKNLTCDTRFESAVKQMCKKELEELTYCKGQGERKEPGHLIPCLLLHRQNITEPRCLHMMTKMQVIVFSNYHLVEGFFDKCHEDVTSKNCGRISGKDDEDEDIHDQNAVLECLEEHQDNLKPECQKEIYRMAELSADDYHLDRPLYYACRNDREKFCSEVVSGEGKVYDCLMKHKFEETMSIECQAKLTTRQQIQSKDYKADYGLLKACDKDFQTYKDEYKCEVGKSPHGSLAGILLCLENALNDGKPVDSKCQSELFEIRQQLMDDYKINPEVVAHCEVEIVQHCSKGKEREGKTLDCLMRISEEGGKISKKCEKAVADLLRETGAGADYRIDHTLYMACEPVVQTKCKDKGKKEGDVMVLSCLMEHLNSDDMNHECHEQLLHLQFFIARDFRLDQNLFQACKKDAQDHCHAPSWSKDSDEIPSGMIVSCLYRNSGEGGMVSKNCANHVRRTMHQRAMDVHLIPEVQVACMQDLGKRCSQNVEKGQELECLQTHLEELTPNCKDVISNFTELEGEDYQLDNTLVRMCTSMVTKFCEDVVSQGDSEGVLPCLIDHKNDPEMDEKCRASIEHWQLIELKDFKFSAKFKKSCRKDVEKNCPKTHDKHSVIKCLSLAIRDAILKDQPHSISEKCRKELRIAEKEEGENIHFDPELFGACSTDAETLCSHVSAGKAKVLECLKDNEDSLTGKCKLQLFEREKEEMADPEIDYKLVKTCQIAIQHYCEDTDPQDLLKCLKKYKREPKVDANCRALISKRQKAQYKDVQLDPELQGACKRDIKKFCSNLSHGKDGKGQMVTCLKKNLDRLSEDCEAYIRSVMHEEALDYRLDPGLSVACVDVIHTLCGDIEPGRGKVDECLRNEVEKIDKRTNAKCYTEVIRTMKEGKTDIYADPMLHDACKSDILHYCDDVQAGHGRVMDCLMQTKKSKTHRLSKSCNAHFNLRMRMWGVAKIAPMETLFDVANAVNTSPSKNYFFMIFAIALSLIFIGGLVFGRLSKRVKKEFKDR